MMDRILVAEPSIPLVSTKTRSELMQEAWRTVPDVPSRGQSFTRPTLPERIDVPLVLLAKP